MGKIKKYEKDALYEFKNDRSLLLFGKSEYDLNYSEKNILDEYVNDCLHPTWKQVIVNGTKYGYEISSAGLLRNMITGSIIEPYSDKDGYQRVGIRNMGKAKNISIHRLVALMFIPNPENKPQVNHINAIKICNWYKNLEWVTAKENIYHAMKMGLENHLGLKGESNLKSKYTEKQIRKACEMMQFIQNTPRYIYKITGVNETAQNSIKKGLTWTHISKDYVFPKVNYRYGELNNKTTYSNEMIHKICKLLEDPTNYPAKVAKELGVSKNVVRQIYHGKTRKDIYCQYNINERNLQGGENAVNSIYKNSQIEEACRLMKDPYMPYTEITKMTGVRHDTLDQIIKCKSWQFIADKYKPFPDRINKKSEMILKLYNEGFSYPQIYEKMKREFFEDIDRRKGTNQIGGVIRDNIKKNKENKEKL